MFGLSFSFFRPGCLFYLSGFLLLLPIFFGAEKCRSIFQISRFWDTGIGERQRNIFSPFFTSLLLSSPLLQQRKERERERERERLIIMLSTATATEFTKISTSKRLGKIKKATHWANRVFYFRPEVSYSAFRFMTRVKSLFGRRRWSSWARIIGERNLPTLVLSF